MSCWSFIWDSCGDDESMTTRIPQDWRPQIAFNQARAFTTAQAVDSGLSARQIEYRLKVGTLIRVVGDGLRHKSDPVTPQMLAYGAHLTWPDTVLCGPLAAALLGAPLSVVCADVIATDKRKPRLALIPHKLQVSPEETIRWRGIQVSSFKRALFDSFMMLPEKSAESLFVWAHTKNKLDVAELEEYLLKYPGRRGNNRIRRYVRMGTGGAMSAAEERAHTILKQAGLMGWTPDAVIRDDQGILARVDILFTRERVVIEIDGRQFHGTDRFQLDRDRDNLLHSAGYLVLRFTWHDLTQRPRQMVAQIEQVLALRKSSRIAPRIR